MASTQSSVFAGSFSRPSFGRASLGKRKSDTAHSASQELCEDSDIDTDVDSSDDDFPDSQTDASFTELNSALTRSIRAPISPALQANYKKTKRAKLQQTDSELRTATSTTKPQIFQNAVVHVTGYTQPSAREIRKLVVSHGGRFLPFLDDWSEITHIVAQQLAAGKMEEYVKKGKAKGRHPGGIRVVRPEWVVECVRAEKMLGPEAFAVKVGDESAQQKRTGQNLFREAKVAGNKAVHSGVSTLNRTPSSHRSPGTVQAPESSLTSAQRSTVLSHQHTVGQGLEGHLRGPGVDLARQVRDPDLTISNSRPHDPKVTDDDLIPASISAYRTGSGIVPSNRPKLASASKFCLPPKARNVSKSPQKEERISSISTFRPDPLHETLGPPGPHSGLPPVVDEILDDTNLDDITRTTTVDDIVSPDQEFESHMAPEIEDETSGPARTPSPIEDPSTVRAPSTPNSDPAGFIQTYYANSRLHHLSTWRNSLQSLITSHQQRHPPIATKNLPHRFILHADFDAFFASVSGREYLSRKNSGKGLETISKVGHVPIAVAHGSGPTTCIASCNYPARKFGIKNGMMMRDAKARCRELLVVGYEFSAYEKASHAFYETVLKMFGEKGCVVKGVSVDEVVVDATARIFAEDECAEKHAQMASALAQDLRSRVYAKTSCSISVGIGPNPLLARIALKQAKPDGLYAISSDEAQIRCLLDPLPVRDIPGVGRQMAGQLNEEMDVSTIEQLRQIPKADLVKLLGSKLGEKIWGYARGVDNDEISSGAFGSESDDRPVGNNKSVAAEITWGIRLHSIPSAERFVTHLCAEVHRRLQTSGLRCQNVMLKLMRRADGAPETTTKYLGHGDCVTLCRSVPLVGAADAVPVLARSAIGLLRKIVREGNIDAKDIRGLGVHVGGLTTQGGGQKALNFGPSKSAAPPADTPQEQSNGGETAHPRPHTPVRNRTAGEMDVDIPTPTKACPREDAEVVAAIEKFAPLARPDFGPAPQVDNLAAGVAAELARHLNRRDTRNPPSGVVSDTAAHRARSSGRNLPSSRFLSDGQTTPSRPVPFLGKPKPGYNHTPPTPAPAFDAEQYSPASVSRSHPVHQPYFESPTSNVVAADHYALPGPGSRLQRPPDEDLHSNRDSTSISAASTRTRLNLSGSQFFLPSQADPRVLAELPEDVRSRLRRPGEIGTGVVSRSPGVRVMSETNVTPPLERQPLATLSRTTSDTSNRSNPTSAPRSRLGLPRSLDVDADLVVAAAAAAAAAASPAPRRGLSRTTTRLGLVDLPTASQLDPDTFSALPLDLQNEIMQEYATTEAGPMTEPETDPAIESIRRFTGPQFILPSVPSRLPAKRGRGRPPGKRGVKKKDSVSTSSGSRVESGMNSAGGSEGNITLAAFMARCAARRTGSAPTEVNPIEPPSQPSPRISIPAETGPTPSRTDGEATSMPPPPFLPRTPAPPPPPPPNSHLSPLPRSGPAMADLTPSPSIPTVSPSFIAALPDDLRDEALEQGRRMVQQWVNWKLELKRQERKKAEAEAAAAVAGAGANASANTSTSAFVADGNNIVRPSAAVRFGVAIPAATGGTTTAGSLMKQFLSPLRLPPIQRFRPSGAYTDDDDDCNDDDGGDDSNDADNTDSDNHVSDGQRRDRRRAGAGADTSLPSLRTIVTSWTKTFPRGPYPEDVSALSEYLRSVVVDEKDMAKADQVARWLDWSCRQVAAEEENDDVEMVDEDGDGDDDDVLTWEQALKVVDRAIRSGVKERRTGRR